MITKKDFDQLVAGSEKYLTEFQKRIKDMEAKLEDYEQRLAHMENRKKPGPKPKAQAA